MSNTIRTLFGAALILAAFASATPGFARDNAPGGNALTKGDLEGDGYTCSLVSVGFWECTKPGGTTYWCDTGSCQPKPRVQQPKTRLPRADVRNQILTQ